MGILTQDALKTEIRAGLGNRADTDDRLTNVLNIIQDSIVRNAAARGVAYSELDGTKTFDLTASTATRTFEEIEAGLRIRTIYDLRIVQAADPTDSRKLVRVEPAKMDEIIPDSLRYAEGTPSVYVEWDDNLEFFAIPDAIYNMNMRVAKWCTQFVGAAGSQLSDLDGKDDALIYGSLHYLFHSLGLNDSGKMYFAKFQDALGDSRQENEAEQDRQIVGVLDPHGRRGIVRSHGDYWNDPFVTRIRG